MLRISVAYRTIGARVVPVGSCTVALTRKDRFPGAQPVSFAERDLDRLVESEYVWVLLARGPKNTSWLGLTDAQLLGVREVRRCARSARCSNKRANA